MRKLLLSILIALILPSVAAAQDAYAGLSFGVGFVGGGIGTAVPITAQVGFEVAPSIDIRTDLSAYVTGTGFQIGANGLYKFDTGSDEVVGYGGGGVRLLTGSGLTFLGLGALGGAEYMVSEEIGVFGEAGADIFIAGGSLTLFKLVAGANYHF